ncbi:MAG: radical SAM protein [Deltaproteobacteria bacterium]|nr:radical SAM protein [Deltaproteobacteria bacterium]
MKVLLIIPSITDFAAHDMWAAPYGMMVIASALKKHNIEFDILDLLGRNYTRKEYEDGRRRYKRTIIEMPKILRNKNIKRHYAIYGANFDDIEAEVEKLTNTYKLIVMSTTMTYWYYGYKYIYERLKNRFQTSTFAIGGVYVTLLESHSKTVFEGAHIFPNQRLQYFDKLVSEIYGKEFTCFSQPFSLWEFPDVESFSHRRYIPALLMRGCPFNCTYCASKTLVKNLEHKDPIKLADWVIQTCETTGIDNVALFDDAFLYRADEFAKPFLRRIMQSNLRLRLHASNGLHPRFIDEELASLMRKSGFETIRLSLESSDEKIMSITGDKVKRTEYENAIKYLQKSGYKKAELGTYIICGIPHQSPQEVIDSIKYVDDIGGVVYLAEYSPIPNTPLFYESIKISRYDLHEPLWQNNTLMSYWNPSFNEEVLNKLKNFLIGLRKDVDKADDDLQKSKTSK